MKSGSRYQELRGKGEREREREGAFHWSGTEGKGELFIGLFYRLQVFGNLDGIRQQVRREMLQIFDSLFPDEIE